MASLVGFLQPITARHIVSVPPSGEEVPLSVLASLDAAVRANGTTAVHGALHETLLRLGETHILSNTKIARLIDLWDGIVGTARERIKDHLTEMLGASPDDALVTHVFRCLSGSAAQRGRHSGEHMRFFDVVVERLGGAAADTDKALRCECCGYHFRIRDVVQEKVRTVQEQGLVLERSLFPGRANDPYKPIQRGGNDSLTRLSIDHVIPEETLGWSEADNLEILCAFCNFGKLAYRRPLEAISSFAVGALAEVPRNRSWSILKHQIVVAALRCQGGQCNQCARTRREVELTVRPTPRTSDGIMQGFAPWNLRTLCYVCIEALGVDEAEKDGHPSDQAGGHESTLSTSPSD